jgi:hypothetical protein
MDLLYIGIGAAFFLLTWGLAIVCERIGNERPGRNG